MYAKGIYQQINIVLKVLYLWYIFACIQPSKTEFYLLFTIIFYALYLMLISVT